MPVVNALRRSDVYDYRGILLALLICIMYAISDEVHQIFIPGRSGEIRDIIIDSAGSSVGILGYLAVSWVAGIKNREAVRMAMMKKMKILLYLMSVMIYAWLLQMSFNMITNGLIFYITNNLNLKRSLILM